MIPPNSLEEPSDFWDSLFNQPLLSGDLGGTRLTIGFGQSSTTLGAEELGGREGGKSEGLDGRLGLFSLAHWLCPFMVTQDSAYLLTPFIRTPLPSSPPVLTDPSRTTASFAHLPGLSDLFQSALGTDVRVACAHFSGQRLFSGVPRGQTTLSVCHVCYKKKYITNGLG